MVYMQDGQTDRQTLVTGFSVLGSDSDCAHQIAVLRLGQ